MAKLKTCSKCAKALPLAAFSPHATGRDKLRADCKSCNSAQRAAYRKANLEHCRRRDRLRARGRSKEQKKAYQAHWYATNKPRLKAKRVDYYSANKEQINIRQALYNANHVENQRRAKAAYYLANKQKLDLRNTEAVKAGVKNLRCWYIKMLIKQEAIIKIESSSIPDALIQAKREQLLFHRSLKETKRVVQKQFTSKPQPAGHGRPKPDANRRITNSSSAHNDGRSTRRG